MAIRRHLNTLFVTTQRAYLSREGETVAVRVERESKVRVPIRSLESIVCFGNVRVSPFLLGLCGERGVAVSFLSRNGRFLARAVGPVAGNVLLRREQYRWADDPERSTQVARAIVAGKIANSRSVLRRAARERGTADAGDAADELSRQLRGLRPSLGLDQVRGLEGQAARTYFRAFGELVLHQREDFGFERRTRRPPRDPMNALLSFLYTLLRHDVRAALEAVGLDPAVGFLHRDRPGRYGLALDLMEELRSVVADRLALALVNRRQLDGRGFTATEAGGSAMRDKTRKTVLVAYQKQKERKLRHPFLDEDVTLGRVPYLQALLLARRLRGDLDAYPPFVSR